MERFTMVALLFVSLVATSMACSSGGGGGGSSGGSFDIPRSNSGRPLGVDITDNTEVYPHYDSGRVGVGVEHRPNENTRINVEAGVDKDGNPSGNVGVTIKFRRRRDVQNVTAHDKETNRKLFKIFDLNNDRQIDVKEWYDEGGKIGSFADLLDDYDRDFDQMISLAEFSVIPVQRGLEIDVTENPE